MENYTLPVAYFPPLLCTRNEVRYTHHQNDKYVTLFAGVAVMQQQFTLRLAKFMLFFGQ
jgi:hypothetical protein